jgi:succinate dehydrogenase/fumarate reductase flavoprotein subunit
MEGNECKGIIAYNMADETIHRMKVNLTVISTDEKAYFSCTTAHTFTGDGGGMVARVGLPIEIPEFV